MYFCIFVRFALRRLFCRNKIQRSCVLEKILKRVKQQGVRKNFEREMTKMENLLHEDDKRKRSKKSTLKIEQPPIPFVKPSPLISPSDFYDQGNKNGMNSLKPPPAPLVAPPKPNVSMADLKPKGISKVEEAARKLTDFGSFLAKVKLFSSFTVSNK